MAKTIAYAMRQSLQKQANYGHSKEQMKNIMQHKTTEPVPGIYSYTTMKSYIQTVNEYSKWLSEFKNIKYVKDIDKAEQYAKEYLKCRELNGCSQYTIAKDKSAISKALSIKIDYTTHTHSQEITRSREQKSYEKHISENGKYKDIFTLCHATGLRRHEVTLLRPCNLKYDKDNLYIVVERGKGGKYRESIVLPKYRQQIIDIFNKAKDKDRVFDNVPKKIDIHHMRGEYAKDLYREIQDNREFREQIKERFGISEKGVYYMRGNNVGIKFNKEDIKIISTQLGHNRIDTTICNYIK